MDPHAETPLVMATVLLEKFPGKGGWTFARMPEIPQQKRTHSGWKKVRGYIDDVEVSESHLMPMGNGTVFLPVKAEIRKKLNKQAGDRVKVVLYTAIRALPITDDDFFICLADEPEALKNFNAFPKDEQTRFLKWIDEVTSEGVKVERMAQAISRILENRFLWNK